MNREELNWLLQTIKDSTIAERFVAAQYERGRISLEMMAEVAREHGWINYTASHFFTAFTCDSVQFASSQLPIAIDLGAAA